MADFDVCWHRRRPQLKPIALVPISWCSTSASHIGYAHVQENVKVNKVSASVSCFCLDGREFVKMVNAASGWSAQKIEEVKGECEGSGKIRRLPSDWARPDQGLTWHHAVMNLPKTAVLFCDAFSGIFDKDTWQGPLPLVHCYSFQKSETDEGVFSIRQVSA